MKKGIFVSGTDTGVGKTIVCSLLLSALKAHEMPAGYFKPIQTGTDLDTLTVSDLSGTPISSLPAPVYYFPEPISPGRAAQIHGAQIQLDVVLESWHRLDAKYWVVEGVGGLMVPLDNKSTFRDLVCGLNQKLVLVASTRLGTINHTLLSLEAARIAGIEVLGIVLVGPEDPGLDIYLTEFSKVPVIASVPQMDDISPTRIQEAAPFYFSRAVLERLYG